MQRLLLLASAIMTISFTIWEPDFEVAIQKATAKQQLILLNFSGSDWCGPCMSMRNEIFDAPAFLAMADTSIVMVNADFPRNKKNQLDKKRKAANEQLADKYNPEGKFPFTLLLNADGKIIKTWEGMPTENVAEFTLAVKRIANANQ